MIRRYSLSSGSRKSGLRISGRLKPARAILARGCTGYASGTITVRISDDQKFDRQVMIPPVLFRGGKHENFNSNNQQSYWYSTCRLRVTRNGQEIFNQSTTDAHGVFSSVIDMPVGQGTLTLTFTVSSSGANNWTPTTSISDLLVVVMKKSTAGISIS